jgi:TetR/AcrR family transcriptional regulator
MPEPPTRDQILDAAERLFAARGFPRTTVKQIGAAAGVNSALLYYYFGDKERLYREVLDRLVGRLVEHTLPRLRAGGSPAARLRRFIEGQAEALAASPNLARLLMRELVDHEAAFAQEQVRQLSATSFRALTELIREGQRSGAFRPDLDSRYAAVSIVAQLAHFLMAWPAVRILLDAPTGAAPAATVREFARHAADFALAGLARAPARSRSAR